MTTHAVGSMKECRSRYRMQGACTNLSIGFIAPAMIGLSKGGDFAFAMYTYIAAAPTAVERTLTHVEPIIEDMCRGRLREVRGGGSAATLACCPDAPRCVRLSPAQLASLAGGSRTGRARLRSESTLGRSPPLLLSAGGS